MIGFGYCKDTFGFRPNIFLDYRRVSGDAWVELDFLFEEIAEKGRDTPKTILFCR